ncbi:MAG: bifunctional ADP-dependent NAD(P)H-hydrate dehydratase/NAD(P)H-hydrate epimerase, partial [Clostridia bacterium]|nr:bifunctional ADP-dependent NAD(P)H-hydrate dehydratase/NAD(P)H-hydrate epimerase [Clostridia bacterium]
GGSGDVLAGCIAALLAQGLPAADAAILGVYLHSCAGELAANRYGAHSMLPRDVIEHLPAAWLELEQ